MLVVPLHDDIFEVQLFAAAIGIPAAAGLLASVGFAGHLAGWEETRQSLICGYRSLSPILHQHCYLADYSFPLPLYPLASSLSLFGCMVLAMGGCRRWLGRSSFWRVEETALAMSPRVKRL